MKPSNLLKSIHVTVESEVNGMAQIIFFRSLDQTHKEIMNCYSQVSWALGMPTITLELKGDFKKSERAFFEKRFEYVSHLPD